MKYPKNFKKYIATFLFIIILIHFLKDITQDILGIATPLDALGDIQENITQFPTWLAWLWYWAMVNTFFGEFILILLIPKYLFNTIGRTEKFLIVGLLVYIPIMFLCAYFLSL
ncbi:MAG: hypothetical protein WCJ58_01385 [bacterium]